MILAIILAPTVQCLGLVCQEVWFGVYRSLYGVAAEVVAYYKGKIPCGQSPNSIVYPFYNVAGLLEVLVEAYGSTVETGRTTVYPLDPDPINPES